MIILPFDTILQLGSFTDTKTSSKIKIKRNNFFHKKYAKIKHTMNTQSQHKYTKTYQFISTTGIRSKKHTKINWHVCDIPHNYSKKNQIKKQLK